jgi:hypothetical protein
MKELVLSQLKNVQEVLNNFIYPLKDKYDTFGRFNYYWDVLEFIKWIEVEEPGDYEINNLEICFNILNEFGEVYLKVFTSHPAYRHDDGILGIDVPMDTMIKKFYDYVIHLQENEIPVSDNNTLSLTEIMAGIQALQATVDTAILQKPVGDAAKFAKEIVKEVLSPVKTNKKLTKTEEFDADVLNKLAERKLKMAQKSLKHNK